MALALAAAVAAFGCDDDDPTGMDTDPSVNGGATAGTTGATDSSSNGATGNGASTSGNGSSGDSAGVGSMDGTGSAGTTGGASGNGTGASEDGCSRELLAGTIDAYFAALEAHDPSPLPLAPDVRYTENGETVQVGEGLWLTAGALAFKRSALDTEACATVTEAVLPNDSQDFVVGLRLKLEEQQISEIESILVAPGVYLQSPEGLVASADDDWETVLPSEQRPTREALKQIVDDYFGLFSGDVTAEEYPFASTCRRFENGTDFANCREAIPPPGDRVPVRTYILDAEAGIAAGFVALDFSILGTYIDFHMFKVRSGEVQGVHALLAPGSSSGWE